MSSAPTAIDPPRPVPWLPLLGVVASWLATRLLFFGGLSASDPLEYLGYAHRLANGTFELELHHYATRFAVTAPIALCFELFGVSVASALAWPLCCSLATLVLLFFLGRRFGNDATGLLAAGFFAILPLDVSESTNVLPDPIVATFATLAAVCWLHGLDRSEAGATARGRLWLLLAGASLWCAYSAKIVGALVALVFFLDALPSRRRLLLLPWVAAGTLALLIPEFTWYHAETGRWALPFQAISAVHEQSDGVQLANSDLAYRLLKDYPRKILLPSEHFGWFGVPLVGALIWMAPRWRRQKLLYVWIVVLFLYLDFGSSSLSRFVAIPANTRYLQPVVVPALVILALAGQRIWGSGSELAARGVRRAAVALGAATLLLSSLGTAWLHSGKSFTHLTAREGLAAAEWLAQRTPRRVYVDRRTEQILRFAFGYRLPFATHRFPSVPSAETGAACSGYASGFEPGDVLVLNWRENLKLGPLGEFDRPTARALQALPAAPGIETALRIESEPPLASMFRRLATLPGFREGMRRDEILEFLIKQEQPRGTTVAIVTTAD